MTKDIDELPRYLITAGNTREMIDEVRDWGNIFTGETGFDIASELAESGLGHAELLSSNGRHHAKVVMLQKEGVPISARAFRSHADLKRQIESSMRSQAYAGVFMTAAVSDYRPTGAYAVTLREPVAGQPGVERWTVRNVDAAKVKSNHPEIAFL